MQFSEAGFLMNCRLASLACARSLMRSFGSAIAYDRLSGGIALRNGDEPWRDVTRSRRARNFVRFIHTLCICRRDRAPALSTYRGVA
jgi:hypothetical protein